MISFAEARARILDAVSPLGVESVRLDRINGCYLAEPIIANRDMPGFDNSAVDGFGVLVNDVARASVESPVQLQLSGVIQAGDSGESQLAAGCALKILTGAVVPDSVQAVIMREYCQESNGHVTVSIGARLGENIRRRAGEYQQGQEILTAGVLATPPIVGLLAALGHKTFPVHKKPRVAVVGTGDELVKPGRQLGPGQIYDSNSYALRSAVVSMGLNSCRTYTARDDFDSTRSTLKAALVNSDVLITAGGVSVGDYDIVKDVLEECGVQGLFWRIAIKPGKPVYFGTLDSKRSGRRKLVFGLPGNPVSALVTFHLFVRPALLKVSGAGNNEQPLVKAKLTASLKKKSGRMEFVRGILRYENGLPEAQPVTGQDSHMLGGLSQANCLIHFPLEAEVLERGSEVLVEQLHWTGL